MNFFGRQSEIKSLNKKEAADRLLFYLAHVIDSLALWQNIRDANAKVVIDDDDFALSDQFAVEQNIKRLIGQSLKFDNRTGV